MEMEVGYCAGVCFHFLFFFSRVQKFLRCFVPRSTGATAELQLDTEKHLDGRAMREQVLKNAAERAEGFDDDKVYKGMNSYIDYRAGFRKEHSIASEKGRNVERPWRFARLWGTASRRHSNWEPPMVNLNVRTITHMGCATRVDVRKHRAGGVHMFDDTGTARIDIHHQEAHTLSVLDQVALIIHEEYAEAGAESP